DEFSLQVDHFASEAPIDILPTRVYLDHSDPSGTVNRLSISLEMFSMLMQLHRRMHYPSTGVGGGLLSSLRLFLGRIRERDEQEIYCYDPRTGEGAFKVAVERGREGALLSMERVV
ncbi:MAG: hypothetical protein JRN15_11325, partial [Nitrososphaerota archaeon]|nr:hypothetical protein [Nitrososphaerota archaeon]